MTRKFSEWLNADKNLVLKLMEVSTEFPKSEINEIMFYRQIRRLLNTASSEQKKDLEQMLDFDYVGYIGKSLRNAGFREADIDSMTQDIIVRLLIDPGNLFLGWRGQPLLARFKTSVRNAILNMVEKKRRRRRYFTSSAFDQYDIPSKDLPHGHEEDAIENFRKEVRQRLGDFALAVLDARLNGESTKSLVGSPGFGNPPTLYKIKNTVQAIKKLATEYFIDPELQRMIQMALDAESRTLGLRFGSGARV